VGFLPNLAGLRVALSLHEQHRSKTPSDRRNILAKTKRGLGVGIPNTYLIDLELLRDLNRRGRYPPAPAGQGRRPGDIPTPVKHPTNIGEAGNGTTLVERREVEL